ncbi:hypothetical protein JHK82_020126 [Glycine max]|nr:hypothetical protein JHK85_020577 [Glycine max]KAG5135395.1 hypothetical protein JHK82_020126 [Glycine max]
MPPIRIRRLRLDSDSDGEEQDPLQPQSEPQTHFPVEISDDEDFLDVLDSLPPPSPACPVTDFLRRLGLSPKSDWLTSCLREFQSSVPAFEHLDVAAKAKRCFEQFLYADMNFCGSGILPPNVDAMHLNVLPGPYVLQVDEIINMTCPLRGRYEKANPGIKRCLKLSMTDGIQRVFGMEYRPIEALEVCASSGLKVTISNVHVRRGLLMLVPETIEILGGLVEELDAARNRLVGELKKPPRPRGRRTRNGVFIPLATRATLAAWPPGGVDDLARSGSTLHSTDPVQENNQGSGPSMSGTGNSNSIPHMASNADAMNMDMSRDTNSVSRGSSMANQLSSVMSKAEEMHIDASNVTREYSVDHQSSNMVSNVSAAYNDTVHITRESSVATECPPVVESVETYRDRTPVATDSSHPRRTSSTVREYSVDNRFSNMVSNVSVVHNDTVHITRESSATTECPPVVENVETYRDRTPAATDSSHPRRASSSVLNTSDVEMGDASDHPLILSGDQEVPFTYMASLSAKWAKMKEEAPAIRGKIKCFLTGVKGFRYKKRTSYELQAYVDDGSLISEILIDHDVVQKGIGFSPEEVTAAISSPDTKTVQQMRDTMHKFQAFLANFEGIILVELNKKSSLPLALEMSQGCPQSDARLLLRRLKSLNPPQVQKPTDPIELSP